MRHVFFVLALLCTALNAGIFYSFSTIVMPGLDLGLVVAAQHLKKLRTRPDAKRLLKIAEAWRPWRSAAALLLWHYRRRLPDWGPKPLKEDIKVGKTAK